MQKIVKELKTEGYGDETNYIVENGFAFCNHCNETVLTPNKANEIIKGLREKWIREGEWDKFTFHMGKFEITCGCGHKNYLALFAFQYISEDSKYYYKRYRYGTIQFPNKEEMANLKSPLDTFALGEQ
jgi:hypothetical protein